MPVSKHAAEQERSRGLPQLDPVALGIRSETGGVGTGWTTGMVLTPPGPGGVGVSWFVGVVGRLVPG
jgi:hypothetical protein